MNIFLHEDHVAAIEPAPFQFEDMDVLEDRVWSCNWSEMGCYKTSTVLWMIPRWAARLNIEKPKVLIITTRSGKGTYFKHVPDLLPQYDLFNLTVNECRLIMLGQDFPVPFNPEYGAASVFVAHYNVFSRRKARKKKKKAAPEVVDNDTGVTEDENNDENNEEEVENDPRAGMSEEEIMLAELLGEITAPKKKEKKVPLIDVLQQTHWDVIILDEAHRIKGRTTGWTKEIKKLKASIKHVMTGTGFINDPSEIWSLLNFCSKREYASYWRFREKYAEEDIINGFRKIVGVRQETKAEFQALVRTVGPRRTKREVFKNLPEPIYSPVYVELNAIQRKMYEEIKDELFTMDQDGSGLFAPNVLAALVRLRQISDATPQVIADYYDPVEERRVQKIKLVEPSSKIDAIMEIIEGLEWDEERRDQVVVFSSFKDPLELLRARLEPQYDIGGNLRRDGIPYIELAQKDNDKIRYQKWAVDFPKKEHQVFMSTLALGAESISLTSASTCIFLDRSYSPKDNSQAESRVWRPGQEEVANIIHINATDTIDEKVFAITERKQGWFNEIFG
jgi:SNF2 family DNA or RNA helicase